MNVIPFYKPRRVDTAAFFDRAKEIISDAWFTNGGRKVTELEGHIAELHGVEHCIAVCNATIGLQLLLNGLDLAGEVITTPFTFIATAHAIKWQRLTPVFCDIDPITLTLDPRRVAEHITPHTSAILGVHVFGQPCDTESLDNLGKEKGFKVVYDAAHCFMTSHHGTPVAQFGEASVLSFHATKIFHTFEGGAVLTNNSELAAKLRLLKNFGFKGVDWVDYLGINAKMPEMSAAYGLALLPYMPETIQRFQRIQNAYRAGLNDVPGISFFELEEGVRGNRQYVVMFVDAGLLGLTRNQLWAWLWKQGVESRRYFYPGVHMCEPYRSGKPWFKTLLPVANRVTASVLCLPSFFDLGDGDLERIIGEVRYAHANSDEVRRWFGSFLEAAPSEARLKVLYDALLRDNCLEVDVGR